MPKISSLPGMALLRSGNLWKVVIAALVATIACPSSVSAQSQILKFVNTKYHHLPPLGDGGAYFWEGAFAQPGPSAIQLNSVPGTILNLKVKISDLRHDRMDDLDLLMVGPDGKSIVLVSDAGGAFAQDGLSMTFTDDASSNVPDFSPPTSGGTYRPTDYPPFDTFPVSGPRVGNLGDFVGTNPNGEWRLYAVDDELRVMENADQLDGLWGGWEIQLVTSQSDSVTAPANDSFMNAIPLSGTYGRVQVPSTGMSPTAETGELFGTQVVRSESIYGHNIVETGYHNSSLWFTWSMPETIYSGDRFLSLSTFGSKYPANVEVFEGSNLTNLTSVTFMPFRSMKGFFVQPGKTYQIRTNSSSNSNQGDLSLYWDTVGSREIGAGIYVNTESHYYQVIDYNFMLKTTVVGQPRAEPRDHTISYLYPGWWTSIIYDMTSGQFADLALFIHSELPPSDSSAPSPSDQPVNRPTGVRASREKASEDVYLEDSQFSSVAAQSIGTYWMNFTYDFTSGEQVVHPPTTGNSRGQVIVPFEHLVGLFHYDFTSGRTREVDLRYATGL